MFQRYLPVCLKLFDGGAAAGAAGAGAGDAGSGDQGGTQAAVPGSTRRGKSGDYSNVKFGIQPEDTGASDAGKQSKTGTTVTSDTLEARKSAFQQFLADNKDLDDERQQQLFNRRFKDYKGLQDTVSKNQPVIDMLMQRYKITDGDVAKLTEAIENDDAYWSEAAEDAGMTVDQYKKFQKLQRENEALMKEQRQRVGQEQAEQQLRKWQTEADALKAKYPQFDLSAEIQDSQFKALLRSGIPMETAYNAIHMDDVMQSAVGSAAAAAEQRVVNNIRAKGQRPTESGTASQSAFIVKDDVTKLSKADRAEAVRRAQMGDTITFGRR